MKETETAFTPFASLRKVREKRSINVYRSISFHLLSHIITRFYPVSTRPRTPQIENKKAEYMSNILLQPG